MKTGMRERVGTLAVSLLLAGVPLLHPSLSAPAMAQASGMAGIGASETMTAHAKVTAVDQGARTVTLVGPQKNSLTLKVGDEVRNLAQVKVGDTVDVVYHASVTYVLSPRGAKLPKDSVMAAGTRAAPGQKPAGAIGAKMVVTATVVGVDAAGHTLQLIDQDGGRIRTVDVASPQGQQSMTMIKVGDTITGVVSEGVAVSVQPAT